MPTVIGIDIGGTKCAAMLGKIMCNEQPVIFDKKKIETRHYPNPYEMINQLQQSIDAMLAANNIDIELVESVGISCGGPLDANRGIILSPPNLPGWDEVPIAQLFSEKYNLPVGLQNDANACALAEWKYGAGIGTSNMVFLTFGTGLGAGLILNNQLYSGTNNNAGEVGHIRMENMGPVGYGKAGSFEGFCSGGGIAQLARLKAMEKMQMGERASYFKDKSELKNITAQQVAEAAENGDAFALEVLETCGNYLGKGVSILIDLLNPERIIIGGIYARVNHLLKPSLEKAIELEALPVARKVCKVLPAVLGEQIGDMAAVSVAVNASNKLKEYVD